MKRLVMTAGMLLCAACAAPGQQAMRNAGGDQFRCVPQSIRFDTVSCQTGATRRAMLHNDGPGAVTVLQQYIGIGPVRPKEWSIARACDATVAAGDSSAIDISFHPDTTGQYGNGLFIEWRDEQGRAAQLIVTLSGYGVGDALPRIAVIPASLDFDTAAPGMALRRSVRIVNTGGPNRLNLRGLTVTGQAFSLHTAASPEIDAGDTATAVIQYRPSAAGIDTGTFTIWSDGVNMPWLAVPLSGICGIVEGPRIHTDMDGFRLWGQRGSTTEFEIVIRNVGSSPLLLARQELAVTFGLHSIVRPADSVIGPGDSSAMRLRVTFDASLPSVTVRIASNDPATPLHEIRLDFWIIDDAPPAAAAPAGLRIDGNHPNPFAGTTTIAYTLPRGGRATLAVYDLLGRRVALLEDGMQAAGRHELRWDASGLPAGVYLCRLESGGETRARRLRIVR